MPLDGSQSNDVYERNRQWVVPGAHVYNTPLPAMDEARFRYWLRKNNVPFDPKTPVTDYDMRGFWKGLQSGDPHAMTAIDPNDKKLHYPDYWKTPYHETFSNESQWATQDAPHWTDDDKLVDKNGAVLFDDRRAADTAAQKAEQAMPFDQWKAKRDAGINAAPIPPYVKQQMIGSEDYGEGEATPHADQYLFGTKDNPLIQPGTGGAPVGARDVPGSADKNRFWNADPSGEGPNIAPYNAPGATEDRVQPVGDVIPIHPGNPVLEWDWRPLGTTGDRLDQMLNEGITGYSTGSGPLPVVRPDVLPDIAPANERATGGRVRLQGGGDPDAAPPPAEHDDWITPPAAPAQVAPKPAEHDDWITPGAALATSQWTQDNPLIPKTQDDVDNAPAGSWLKHPKTGDLYQKPVPAPDVDQKTGQELDFTGLTPGPKPPGIVGEAVRGAQRAGLGAMYGVEEAANWVEGKLGDITGNDYLKKSAAQDIIELARREKESQDVYKAGVGTLGEAVQSPGAAAHYVAGKAGEAIPTIAEYALMGIPRMIALGAFDGAAQAAKENNGDPLATATGAFIGAATAGAPIPFLQGAMGKGLIQGAIRSAGLMGAVGVAQSYAEPLPKAAATGTYTPPTAAQVAESAASSAIAGGMFGAFGAATHPSEAAAPAERAAPAPPAETTPITTGETIGMDLGRGVEAATVTGTTPHGDVVLTDADGTKHTMTAADVARLRTDVPQTAPQAPAAEAPPAEGATRPVVTPGTEEPATRTIEDLDREAAEERAAAAGQPTATPPETRIQEAEAELAAQAQPQGRAPTPEELIRSIGGPPEPLPPQPEPAPPPAEPVGENPPPVIPRGTEPPPEQTPPESATPVKPMRPPPAAPAALPAPSRGDIGRVAEELFNAYRQGGPDAARGIFNRYQNTWPLAATEAVRAQFQSLIEGTGKPWSEVQAEAGRAPELTANAPAVTDEVHTKTGKPIFAVRFPQKLDIADLGAQARKLGGYWSSFRGGGMQPGWMFKTREAADRFAAWARGDEPPPTVREQVQAAPSPVEDTSGFIDHVENIVEQAANPQPAPAPEPQRVTSRGKEWTEIGTNYEGHTLWEDHNGIRSIVTPERIRMTEPVSIAPTREGIQYGVDRDRKDHPEYQIAVPHPGTDRTAEYKPGTAEAAQETRFKIANEIADARDVTEHNPTDAQKEAGNYPKGKVNFHGIPFVMENAEGSTRRGVDDKGQPWESTLPADYGYISRTEGADGDHVDAYIGHDLDSQQAFVIDQFHPGDGFDEHKVVLGAKDWPTARQIYLDAFSDGRGSERLGNVTPMSLDDLKTWLKEGDTQNPIGQQGLPLTGPQWNDRTQLEQDGVFTERIGYDTRYFIPTGADAQKVLSNVLERRPVTDFTGARDEGASTYGSGNRVFTQEAAEAARARLDQASKGTLTMGVDPMSMKDLLVLAGYHIEAGLREFADFSRAMIADAGEWVRPHLQALYDQAMAARPTEEIAPAAEPVAPAATDFTDDAEHATVSAAVDQPVLRGTDGWSKRFYDILGSGPKSPGVGDHFFNAINRDFTTPQTKAALDPKSNVKWQAELARFRDAAALVHGYRDDLASWQNKDPATWRKVFAAMELETLEGRATPTDGRAIIVANTDRTLATHSKPGDVIRLTSPDEIQMYGDYRRTMDKVWGDLVAETARQFGWEGVPTAKAIQEAAAAADPREATRLNRAAKIVAAIEYQHRNAYMPLMRSGDYFIRVRPLEGTADKPGIAGWNGEGYPPTVMYKMIDALSPAERALGGIRSGTPQRALDAITDLRTTFPEDEYSIEHGWAFRSADAIRDLDIPALDKLMMLVSSDARSQIRDRLEHTGMDKDTARQAAQNDYDKLVDTVLDQVYEQRVAGFKRQRLGIPGYNDDFAQATGQYLSWLSNHISDLKHRPDIEAADQGIATHPDPRTRAFWRDWDRRQESYGDQMNGPMAKLRQGAFFWLLGMNAATTAKIMLHGPLRGAPILSTGLGAQGRMQAIGSYLAASKDLMRALRVGKDGFEVNFDNLSNLTVPERALIQDSLDKGILHQQTADELAAIKPQGLEALTPRARFTRRVLDIWGSNVSAADRMVRGAMLLAGYRTAQREGMDAINRVWDKDLNWRNAPQKTPQAFGQFMVDKTVGIWGDINRMPIARSQLGGMAMQMKTYEIGWLSNLHQMMTRMGPEGKVTAALMLGGLGMMGGTMALPFAQDIETAVGAAYGAITGITPDLDSDLRNAFEAMIPGSGETMLHGGRPLGIDWSGIGFGDLLSRNAQSPLDFAGAAVSTTLGTPYRAWQRYRSGQGDLATTRELLPNAVKHMLDGLYPEVTAYSISGKSKVQDPNQLSTEDRIKMGLGFQTAEKAQRYEQTGHAIHLQQAFQAGLSNAENRIANLQDRGDTAGAQEAMQDALQLIADGERQGVFTPQEMAAFRRQLQGKIRQRANPLAGSRAQQRIEALQPQP